MATATILPTTGTQTSVWLNWLAGLATALVGMIDPAFLMNLLGSKFGWLIPFIMFVVNAINHALTGNAPSGVAPGIITPAPVPVTDVAKGSIG